MLGGFLQMDKSIIVSSNRLGWIVPHVLGSDRGFLIVSLPHGVGT